MAQAIKPYVLVTRPREEADRTAEEVRAYGFTPLIESLLMIEPLPFTINGDYNGLVFTSANAVRIAAQTIRERNKPVFCVGAHTAAIAREQGWKNIQFTKDNSGTALNALLAGQTFPPGSLFLHLSGDIIATPIESSKFSIKRIPVYKALPIPSFSAETREALMNGGIAAVLFFSARTASVFAGLAEKEGCTQVLSTIKALCLSDSVVKSLEHLRWKSIRIAESKSRDSLLALLEDLSGCGQE